MGITVESHGSFKNTEQFLARLQKLKIDRILESSGNLGVNALRSATPVESGLTAESWSFKVKYSKGGFTLMWLNSHTVGDGVPVAVLLQYGHGTGTGGYVQGYDYINPAIRPIFDKIEADVWKAVKSA